MTWGVADPVSRPSSPIVTASRSADADTMVKTTSRSASSAGLSTIFAPWADSGSAFDLVRLYTDTS